MSPAGLIENHDSRFQRAQRVCRLHGQHCVLSGTSKRSYGVVMQRSELHPLDQAELRYKSIGLADRIMETVSPFNLNLNVAFSGVSQSDGSLMPRLCNRHD